MEDEQSYFSMHPSFANFRSLEFLLNTDLYFSFKFHLIIKFGVFSAHSDFKKAICTSMNFLSPINVYLHKALLRNKKEQMFRTQR